MPKVSEIDFHQEPFKEEYSKIYRLVELWGDPDIITNERTYDNLHTYSCSHIFDSADTLLKKQCPQLQNIECTQEDLKNAYGSIDKLLQRLKNLPDLAEYYPFFLEILEHTIEQIARISSIREYLGFANSEGDNLGNNDLYKLGVAYIAYTALEEVIDHDMPKNNSLRISDDAII